MSGLLSDIFLALDQVVLTRSGTSNESLKLVEACPTWFYQLLPHAKNNHDFCIDNKSAFLQDFIIDALALWSDSCDGKVKSGMWSEVVDEGVQLDLEAIAINKNGLNLLVIYNRSDEYVQRQRTLQSARELNISNEKLIEQHDYLHHRLLNLLSSPTNVSDAIEPLAAAIENAGFAVVLLDNKLKAIIENEALLTIFESSPNEHWATPNPIDTLLTLMREQLAEFDRIIATASIWNGELYWMNPPQTLKWLKVSIYPVKSETGQVSHWLFFINDISQVKYLTRRNEELNHQDTLTGLPNRYSFWKAVDQHIKMGKAFYVLYVDINDFKKVNEYFSHTEGDKLLTELAARLTKSLTKMDLIARVGGDEFAILLNDIHTVEQCSNIANRLLSNATKGFISESGSRYDIGLSVGATSFPIDADNTHELMRFADLSAYTGKVSSRKNSLQFYSTELKEASRNRINIENELRHAVNNQEFGLLLQPILNLDSGKITKVEALIRWQQPVRGLVMPSDFIPIAEANGIIIPIGKWVFSKSCEYLKSLGDAGHNVTMSINVSPKQVDDTSFLPFITQCIEQWQIKPEQLELEITEGVLVDDYLQIQGLLTEVRKMGINVSVDDFGTGYSSLSYLKNLPIDSLKIDRSFIQDLSINNNDKAIVLAIISLAHNLNLRVVAEGVETDEQKEFLAENHCNYAQGYLFSRPVTIDVIMQLLDNEKHAEI